MFYCLTFCRSQLFDFQCNSTDWLPREWDPGVGNYWLTWNLLECSSFAGIFRVRFSLAFWMIFNNFILFFVCATRKRRDIFRAEKLNVVSNDHWHRWKCDFSVRPEILLFFANLVQIIKIVSLSWNLVAWLIQICKIQWWCSRLSFLAKDTLFGQNWAKK